MQTKQLTKTLLISSLALMSAYGYADDGALTYSVSFGTDLVYNGDGFSRNATGLDNVAYGSFGVSYVPTRSVGVSAAVTADDEGGTSYSAGLAYTGIEGLTVGIQAGDSNRNTATGDKKDEKSFYAKYAYGPLTVGIQTGDYTAENTADTDAEFTALGTSFTVSDNLSISYERETDDVSNSVTDQKSEKISASYTMRGMTITAAHTEVDNIAGTNDQDDKGWSLSAELYL